MVPSVNEIELADLDQCCAWIAYGQLPTTQLAADRFKMIVQRGCMIIEQELENIKMANSLPENNLVKIQVEKFFGAMLEFKKRLSLLAVLDDHLINAKTHILDQVEKTEDYLAEHARSNVVVFKRKA